MPCFPGPGSQLLADTKEDKSVRLQRKSDLRSPGSIRTEGFVTEHGPLGGPGLRPYLKSGHPLAEFVKPFKWQGFDFDCEPTQVFNIIRELGLRHAEPTMATIPYQAVSKTLPPALEGAAWQQAVIAIGKKLPKNYTLKYVRGSVDSRWDKVRNILRDEESSLPLISVSSEYWVELFDKAAPEEGMDHTLIVVDANDSEVQLFDSYLPIAAKSTRFRLRGQGRNPVRGVITVSLVNLIKYWVGTNVPRFVFWIQRTGERTKQTTLGEEL